MLHIFSMSWYMIPDTQSVPRIAIHAQRFNARAIVPPVMANYLVRFFARVY
jgi:hypothetical protein